MFYQLFNYAMTCLTDIVKTIYNQNGEIVAPKGEKEKKNLLIKRDEVK